jgi:hypothetical protein
MATEAMNLVPPPFRVVRYFNAYMPAHIKWCMTREKAEEWVARYREAYPKARFAIETAEHRRMAEEY